MVEAPSLPPGYGPEDTERWFPEEHRGSRRSDFARDRARILHSSALRRLAVKTQVVGPSEQPDFARNRLTHSLEVAQIGRELAISLRLDPDVVDAACLSHDLGHPPFGHNGEGALNSWSSDIGGFEGNAQTLRVLTRLEPKVIDARGRSYGLNLTRAVLDASCKYPWTIDRGVADPGGRRKFGVYGDDVEVFDWFRVGAPAERLCIEAQVMDVADDIAYSVHDFEDAIVNGHLDIAALGRRADHEAVCDGIFRWMGGGVSRDHLVAAFDRLDALGYWIDSWDGSRADLARLKNLTSQLIGRFSHAAIHATRLAHPRASFARFGASVVVPGETVAEIAVLKGIVGASVMSADSRQPLYEGQRRVVLELAEALWSRPEELDQGFAADWRDATDDVARRRVIVDQVASLTDVSAIAWHQRLR